MDKSIYTQNYAILLELLVESRIDAGFTQVKLAKKLDITQSALSKFECGERRLDVIQLQTICRQLKLSLIDFITEFEHRVGAKKRGGKSR